MRGVPVFLAALESRGGLRRVLAAYLLYNLTEIAGWMAVVFWAYDRGGATLAGIASVVQLVPSAVLAPMVASAGDRLSRGTALMLAHAFVAVWAALTAFAMAADASVVVVIGTATLMTTAVAVVRPFHYASLPQLAGSARQLVSTNSLSSLGEQIGIWAGPAVAGFGIALSSPAAVMGLLAAVSAVATALCLGLPRSTPSQVDEDDEGLRAAFEGFRALRSDTGALWLLVVMTTSAVIGGALDVLGVSFAEQSLAVDAGGAGLVVGAAGIGGILGSAVSAFFAERRVLLGAIVGAGALSGLAFALVALTDALGPAMTLLALFGVVDAIMLVCARTLLQRATDESVLARVFAVQESMYLLGLALGNLLVPVLVTWFSPAGAFVPLGLGAVAVVLLAIRPVRRLDARAVYLPDEVALLRTVPFLDVLPAYELERLASHARWREVDEGEVVVRQHDEGEEFFVVRDGSFSVSVDGVVSDRLVTAPGSFGEIALLQAVPRTATITATTAGSLLVVDRNDFLGAVTGSVDGNAIASEITAAHLERDRAQQR